MGVSSNRHSVLVVGSSGNLGSSISGYLKNTFNVYETYFSNPFKGGYYLDVLNADSLAGLLNEINPDYVINCCGYTDVDSAEDERRICHDLNVVSVQNILKMIKVETKLIHISTDYVFDGKKGNYVELDVPNPINYYGKTKHEAENLIRGSNKKYIIFRVSVPYEFSENKNNFFMWAYNNLINEKNIQVVDDQISNPTYIPTFAEVVFKSIVMDLEGLFHYGSCDSISRYEFALIISKVFNCPLTKIRKINTLDLLQKAKRPINSTLNTSKIEEILNVETYETEYCIKSIMQEYNLNE